MARSFKKYPVYGGPPSLRYFKRSANRSLRMKSNARLRRLFRADKLDELVLPVIDEVSDKWELEYIGLSWGFTADKERRIKALRK